MVQWRKLKVSLLKIEKAKLNKQGNLAKLLKSLSQLENEKVEVGHFDSQGIHSSGKTYSELMWYHATGGDNTGSVPVRDPQVAFEFKYDKRKNKKTLTQLLGANWLSRGNVHEQILNTVANSMLDEYKSIFGDSSLPAMPPSRPKQNGSTAPLVDTGELVDKAAYRISNGQVITK